MTLLSVNLNKIALLRNARGRDFPNVCDFARQFIDLGVQGITVHPRDDERHITYKDVYDLSDLLASRPHVEYNIEGYPSEHFLQLVSAVKPHQCTLVPDTPDQLTSNHGWNLNQHLSRVTAACQRLRDNGVRPVLFMEPNLAQICQVANTGAQRIELYTEAYAQSYGTAQQPEVLARYRQAADTAHKSGLGVNAGHDLDLHNLGDFLAIKGVLEVSIGQALTVESIQYGMAAVVKNYLRLCRA